MSEPDLIARFENPLLEDGFTAVPNSVIRNFSGSHGAFRLFITLLSFAWQKTLCHPGQNILSEHMGLEHDSITRLTKELVEGGYVSVTRRFGRSNLYTLKFPVHADLRDRSSSGSMPAVLREQKKTKKEEDSTSEPRKRDPLWDVCDEVFGKTTTRSEASRRGKELKQLREIGASPDDLRLVASRYQREHPQWTFSLGAVLSHWTRLSGGGPAGTVVPLSRFACPVAHCGLPFASEARLTEHMENVHGLFTTDEEDPVGA